MRGGGIFAAAPDERVLYSPSVNYLQACREASFNGDLESFTGKIPLPEISKRLKSKKVLCDSSEISHSLALKVVENFGGSIVFCEGICEKIRMVKDKDEIKLVEKACRYARGIIDSVKPEEWRGRSESELAAYIEARSRDSGCGGAAFPPVVASGVNASFPHHFPGPYVIGCGPLKIDCGVKFSEYASDLTRTFILDKLNKYDFLRSIKDKVREAKIVAEKSLGPGIMCKDVHAASSAVFKKYGLEEYFVHNLGHGLGIDVHESPSLSPYSRQVLAEGMIVTVEPGIYIPSEGGIRIEDTYLITREGNRKLTRKFQ